MLRSFFVLASAAVAGALVTGCGNTEPAAPSTDIPSLAQAPATGNGTKMVIPVEDVFSVECGGGQILAGLTQGWIQVRLFSQSGTRNVELDVFHLVHTFTNSAGETYTFHDVGPDRYYVEGENLFIRASSGRLGGGVIGHLVVNLTTDEVEFVAGKEFAGLEALACEALT